MNGIKISLQEIQNAAREIDKCNANMHEALVSMQKEMNRLDAEWISDAGQMLRVKFNAFAARFESQRTLISNYAKFLDLTAESYDALESAIHANAQGMQE